jgi:hypothetical protein
MAEMHRKLAISVGAGVKTRYAGARKSPGLVAESKMKSKMICGGLTMLLAALAALGCEPGPDHEGLESEEAGLKKYNPPGTDTSFYGCPIPGGSCTFAVPSLATFCGDVAPKSAVRQTTTTLLVAFQMCTHPDDLGCVPGQYRSLPADGAIAEVEIRSGETARATYRIKPWQLTTAGCATGQKCVQLNTSGYSYNFVASKPLTGWQRGTPQTPGSNPSTVLIGTNTFSKTP